MLIFKDKKCAVMLGARQAGSATVMMIGGQVRMAPFTTGCFFIFKIQYDRVFTLN